MSRYWTYLPRLFDWAADRDLRPGPFSEVYRLARNALAATVTACGFDPNAGHVLVVYDARNAAFAAVCVAGRQYESAISACRVPGLIRRLSWQTSGRRVHVRTEARLPPVRARGQVRHQAGVRHRYLSEARETTKNA